MTIDRNELIEKMARAYYSTDPVEIYDTNLYDSNPDGVEYCYRYLAFEEWFDEEQRESFKAVLKAIGEYLPATENEHYEKYKHSLLPPKSNFTESDLYTQFKNICEGK